MYLYLIHGKLLVNKRRDKIDISRDSVRVFLNIVKSWIFFIFLTFCNESHIVGCVYCVIVI